MRQRDAAALREEARDRGARRVLLGHLVRVRARVRVRVRVRGRGRGRVRVSGLGLGLRKWTSWTLGLGLGLGFGLGLVDLLDRLVAREALQRRGKPPHNAHLVRVSG